MKKFINLFTICVTFSVFVLLLQMKSFAVSGKVSSAEGLNVRSGPGTSNQVLGAIVDKTQVEIIGNSGGWGKITYKGRDAWVCLQYVSFNADFQVVETDGVNFRSGPGINHSIIGAIPFKEIVSITEVCGDWGKGSYKGRTGWVCMTYVTLKPTGGVSKVSTPTPSRPVANAVHQMSAQTPAAPASRIQGFKSSEALINFIKQREGYVGVPTTDVLVPCLKNIGYGHVVRDGERFTSMTTAEADTLLRNDLRTRFEPAVNYFLQRHGLVASQQHFDALVSYVYNLGVTGLTEDMEFNKWLITVGGHDLNNVNEAEFAAEALKAHHCDKTCVPGLLYRRIAEMKIFFYGDYSDPMDGNLHNSHKWIIPGCIKNKV